MSAKYREWIFPLLLPGQEISLSRALSVFTDPPHVMNIRPPRVLLLSLLVLPLAAVPQARGNAGTVQQSPDIVLRHAIEAALESNFAYRIAALDPEIASQSVTAAESAFDPEVFASGRLSQTEQNTTFTQTTGTSSDNRSWQAGARKRFDYGTSVTAQTNLDRRDSNAGVNTSNLSQSADLSVSIRQPLMRGFGKAANRAGIEGAQAGYAAARESFRDALLGVLAGTERAYWRVARLQEQLELNRSSLRVAETLLEEARERERVGLATRIEVLQAQSSRAERKEQIIETRRDLGDALDELFSFMGTFPADLDALPKEFPTVAGLRQADKTDLPEFREAWEMSVQADPVLARQEARILEQEWQRTAARTDARPSLDLVLSGAYIGIDDREADIAYENAVGRDGHAWAVGVEFSMPWRMRGENAALRSAEKRLEQAELRYLELKQALYRDLRSSWRNLEATTQSLEAARLTVSLQEATFERELGKYQEGVSVFRDVLEARRDLDQARARLLNARFNRLSTEIDLALLTGRLLQRHGLSDGALLHP